MGFGPQAPRDIDKLQGNNKSVFAIAPSYKEMNLCNIHFHKNAEHKAKDYPIDSGSGYQCAISQNPNLSADEQKTTSSICEGDHDGLKPGDTIEVHWVYGSCDTKPGKELDSCVTPSCTNPNLRVESQVFTLVVNDPTALNFNDFDYMPDLDNGYHQAKKIPNDTGKSVEFLGSTTGPDYSDQRCSPYQVTWSVRPHCAKLDMNSIGRWCKENKFKEDSHAHGVRKLVTDPKLLSEIK